MSSGRRFEVNAVQVLASALAAVTGAIAASYLGVAGTLVGAAVMSVASTAVAAVYKHYLGRGHDRLKSAAHEIVPLARDRAVAAALRPPHRDLASRDSAAHGGISLAPDDPPRQHGPARLATDAGFPPASGATADGQPAGTAADGQPAGATADGQAADARGAAIGAADPHQDAQPGQRGGPAARNGRRRWLMRTAVAAGAFVVAMSGITAFEAVTGKPLDAIVWHRPGSDTTVHNLIGTPGSQPRSHPAPRPARSASPSPSRHSSTPPATPSPTPTGSRTPTPTPTPTPSPSPSPSGSASPSPSPSASSP
jgi:hypothetical protein